jgi:hypothetical protein
MEHDRPQYCCRTAYDKKIEKHELCGLSVTDLNTMSCDGITNMPSVLRTVSRSHAWSDERAVVTQLLIKATFNFK